MSYTDPFAAPVEAPTPVEAVIADVEAATAAANPVPETAAPLQASPAQGIPVDPQIPNPIRGLGIEVEDPTFFHQENTTLDTSTPDATGVPMGAPADQVTPPQAVPAVVNPEIEMLKLQVERIQAEAELARYQSTLPAAEEEPSLVVPEAPSAPSDFNPADSFTDSTSSSWRHREAQEQYNREVQEYHFEQSRRDQQTISGQLQRIEENRAAQAQQAEARQAIAGLGADAATQVKFESFLQNEQLTFADMYKLFQLKTGGALDNSPQSPTVPGNPPNNPVQAASRRLDYPIPSAVAAGSGGSQKSLTDTVFDEVMAAAAGPSVAFT